MIRSVCLGVLLASPLFAQAKQPLDPDAIELRPGLTARYESLVGLGSSFTRIDLKPAFTWRESSPHPTFKPGGFRVVWSGVFLLRETEPVRFGAFVSGDLSVRIDGATVLKGKGKEVTSWIQGKESFQREPGLYWSTIEYQSPIGRAPARVQLCWEGDNFAREPVPAWRFKHVAKEVRDPDLDDVWTRGRDLVGQLGCARCHSKTFPAVDDPPPGPSLGNVGQRVKRGWLLQWLANPAKMRAGAHMPLLFNDDRQGFVERWLIADYLLNSTAGNAAAKKDNGDHRAGKQAFIGLGCFTCHADPEKPDSANSDPERYRFDGLADRFSPVYLAAHISDPAIRYPDGRMPKLPVPENTARDIAAYLLLWSKPALVPIRDEALVKPEEIEAVARGLNVNGKQAAGEAVIREKGCARCHPGLEKGPQSVSDFPIRRQSGCVWGITTLPRFTLDAQTRRALGLYVGIDPQPPGINLPPCAKLNVPSAFYNRQRLLRHFKCHRCHQRDEEHSAPIEEIGRTLWTPFLYRLPFQRTPRLTQATAKFTHDYLLKTVRDGATRLRPEWYSYRMPAFGTHAEEIVRALAEADGDLPTKTSEASKTSEVLNYDPNVIAQGPELAGFGGYSCIACHVWNGKTIGEVEPGAVGPDLVTVTQRIRREWFDRFLVDPLRVYPGTPMPAIFQKQSPLASPGRGDGGEAQSARQKEILWAYFSQGKQAPNPKPRPPIPIPAPDAGEPPLVAQIPITLPDGKLMESITVLYSTHDAIVYDVENCRLHSVYTGAQILRQSNTWRSLSLTGKLVPLDFDKDLMVGARKTAFRFFRYYPVRHGVDIMMTNQTRQGPVKARTERVEIPQTGPKPHLARTQALMVGDEHKITYDNKEYALLPPETPPAETISKVPSSVLDAEKSLIGPLTRPGYKAILYPRPKTASGEDLVMPSALATEPVADPGKVEGPSGRRSKLYVASFKLGDLFILNDPNDNGRDATFERFSRGLWQDVFGMLHDGISLFVLQRRNLSRVFLPSDDDMLHQSERYTALPHAIGNAYDWAYGLVQDKQGRFLVTFAPHANQQQAGSGSLLRIIKHPKTGDVTLEEIAFGFRNPLGWCAGPEKEIFFTDNQGEWVATNKLCHVEEGKFYGYPNPAHPEHTKKPMAKTTVWVPYDWARSINGLAYDASGGNFGPFAGQFFMAELMHGGAIIRANVEKVNGVYQGACFPFWGKGLLGPLVLTFDSRGRLWVGGITQPGWMGQPDRGALFRIDYTGPVPFEIQSIHVRPKGFRLVFTAPVDPKTAGDPASYQVEHYRYEYTGAYGSPELDRTKAKIERIQLAADGRSAEVALSSLIKDRCYSVSASGVSSTSGASLVHPTGVYTLNEIPSR
jgi:mono/diheme cytochrome c family protein